MNDKTETMLGVRRIETEEVVGYLINIKISKIQEEYQKERSAMLLYFIDYNNQIFKCYYKYEPYFFVACSTEYLKEMKLYIEKKFESQVSFVKETDKIDLEQINHLSGKKRVYLKIGFRNVSDMYQVRNSIKDKVEKNKNK